MTKRPGVTELPGVSELPGYLERRPDGLLLKVQVQPKASRTEVVGPHGEPPRLKIRVAAPPVEGEANEELLRFLKKKVRVAGATFELLRGATGKSKDIRCLGVPAETLVKFLTA